MSILQDISKRLLDVTNIPPEKRNDALYQVLIYIEEVQYDMVLEQKNLIMSVIKDLIDENDADQIAKSKLVFVEDVEEQIAPTKKTRAKKVVAPVVEDESEDLPDVIENYLYIKDLPEPVKKLAIHRSKEQDKITNLGDLQHNDTLKSILLWDKTPEGKDFWKGIHEKGDLIWFKREYGNKGEKVDEIIEFAELNEFIEELAQPVSSQLPDNVKKNPKIKDLPEPIKKLALFRQKEQNTPYNTSDDVDSFIWRETPEGTDFWNNIEDGKLIEFKRIYGDEGEYVDRVIDGLVGFNELLEQADKKVAPAVKTRKARTAKVVAPVVAKQEVQSVELVVDTPISGIVNLKAENPTELYNIVLSVFSEFNLYKLQFNFTTITNSTSYKTKVLLENNDSTDILVKKLEILFRDLAKPELLDWSNFKNRGFNPNTIARNEEILKDGFKPVNVVTPKVVTPKPAKVVTPKVVKQKVTKPKVEDDLSFLNDLNNIF